MSLNVDLSRRGFLFAKKGECVMLKGTIRKRGEKYQVIFPYKDDEGNYKQKSATVGTQSDANAMLKKFNFDLGEDVRHDNPRISEIRDMWVSEISLHASKNTIKAYTSNSQFVINRLGDMRIKDIQRKDVVTLYQRIKKEGYETKAYQGVFNMMMNFAIKSKYITANPGEGIKTTRTKEKRSARILSMSERIKILSDLKGTEHYFMSIILLKTGLRIGEALGLEWKAIDFDNNTLHVRQQVLVDGEVTTRLKTKNSNRVIYLDAEIVRVLKELRISQYSTNTFVFANYEVSRCVYSKVLEDYDLTPHDLRHNHGTDLLNICNIADAAKRMGHTVEEYVSTYVHPSDESQKQIAEKLNTAEYSYYDRIMTEGVGKVVNMAYINA